MCVTFNSTEFPSDFKKGLLKGLIFLYQNCTKIMINSRALSQNAARNTRRKISSELSKGEQKHAQQSKKLSKLFQVVVDYIPGLSQLKTLTHSFTAP